MDFSFQFDKPDLILLTEHGLKQDQIEHFPLPNFKLCSYYTRSLLKKGGSAIYSKIPCTRISKFDDLLCEQIFELSCVKLNFSTNYLVCCIYRSPQSCLHSFLSKFETFLERVFEAFGQSVLLLIFGDLNIDGLRDNDNDFKRLKSVFDTFGLVNHVREPTRINAQLDYAITNFYHDVTCYVKDYSLSDHKCQILNVKTIFKPSRTIQIKRFVNETSLSKLFSLLSEANWDAVLQITGAEHKWGVFLSNFESYFNISCPEKRVVTKNKNYKVDYRKYPNLEILRQDMLCAKSVLRSDNSSAANKANFKFLKKRFSSELRKIKSQELTSKIRNAGVNISKTSWDIVDQVSHYKKKKKISCSNTSLQVEDNLVTDPDVLCNVFNEHFLNIPRPASIACPPNTIPEPDIPQSIFFSPVTEIELLRIVRDLPNKVSAGIDGVSYKVIKFCILPILSILTYLFNESFNDGIFPDLLKVGIVKPLYKGKGESSNCNNYRPITLTPSFGKIFEKLIYERLLSFFSKYEILNNFQHGFRHKRSTGTALAIYIQQALENLDKKHHVSGCFLDLTRAFDCVNHELLLKKLWCYGVRGNSHSLLSSYLTNRVQIVELLNLSSINAESSILPEISNFKQFSDTLYESRHRSNPQKVNFGVPQGSILGPLFFIIYLNNFPLLFDSWLNLLAIAFADDTSLLLSERSCEDLISRCEATLLEVNTYMSSLNMVLNIEKSEILKFSLRDSVDFCLKLGGNELQAVHSVKLLGVHIDEHLRWDVHIEYLCSRLSSNTYLLWRLSDYLPQDVLLNVYYGVFYSLLGYGIEIWGSASHTERILILQKKAIRNVFKLQRFQSVRLVFKEKGLLTLYSLYIYKVITLALRDDLTQHKCVKDITSYNLRNKNDFQRDTFHFHKTSTGPFTMGKIFFNKLPSEIKSSLTKSKPYFLKKLKDYLILHPFYSISEYLEGHF